MLATPFEVEMPIVCALKKLRKGTHINHFCCFFCSTVQFSRSQAPARQDLDWWTLNAGCSFFSFHCSFVYLSRVL